jgi:hypothetical protein
MLLSVTIKYYPGHEEPVPGRSYQALAQREKSYVVEASFAEEDDLRQTLENLLARGRLLNWRITPVKGTSMSSVLEDINHLASLLAD